MAHQQEYLRVSPQDIPVQFKKDHCKPVMDMMLWELYRKGFCSALTCQGELRDMIACCANQKNANSGWCEAFFDPKLKSRKWNYYHYYDEIINYYP